MTLEQLDAKLEELQARASAALTNMFEFDSQPTYRRLKGEAGASRIDLAGQTRDRAAAAVAGLADAFPLLSALQQVLDRAAVCREAVRRFRAGDAKLRELEGLLLGPSVVVSEGERPLADRSLFSSSEVSARQTPDALLAALAAAFDSAKTVVFQMEAAWNRLAPEISKLAGELETLRKQALDLQEDCGTDLGQLDAAVKAIAARVQNDPLGTDDAFAREIRPQFQAVQDRLKGQAARRDGLRADLRFARDRLKEMAGLMQQCAAVYEECRQKVAAGAVACPAGDGTTDLNEWLYRLDTHAASGGWKGAAIGLQRWQEAYDARSHELAGLIASNQRLLDARVELRGRLSALSAKAQARGVGEDPSLVEIASGAQALLSAPRTPLDRVGALVERYEEQLRKVARS